MGREIRRAWIRGTDSSARWEGTASGCQVSLSTVPEKREACRIGRDRRTRIEAKAKTKEPKRAAATAPQSTPEVMTSGRTQEEAGSLKTDDHSKGMDTLALWRDWCVLARYCFRHTALAAIGADQPCHSLCSDVSVKLTNPLRSFDWLGSGGRLEKGTLSGLSKRLAIPAARTLGRLPAIVKVRRAQGEWANAICGLAIPLNAHNLVGRRGRWAYLEMTGGRAGSPSGTWSISSSSS